ncbi:MAG TPA: hypothetical protein GXZ92_03165 [Clostridiales bacterium]|jgi:two-component SAPR family response regulator|nr:hypothetical protein [Clostridiales bacterium]
MELFNITTNKLINDIMSNDALAVMLFAPAGSGKTDFLTELGNRYRTVFWFNALTDNVESFSLCLAEKIFRDNPSAMQKIKQLRYSESELNNEVIIITALLQHISTIKGNCLLVFERMEMLPENFDYGLIERLIKHCPKNLKIVVSSDSFINFDYNAFEPLCPILIDENVLGQKPSKPDFVTYVKDFNAKQKAFLAYISDLDYLDRDFIKTFYPEGVEVLERLSCQECYVVTRDIKYFRLNTLFRKWLQRRKDEFVEELKFFDSVNAAQRLGDYLLSEKRYYDAFKVFHKAGDMNKIEYCLQGIFSNKSMKLNLFSYAKYYKNTVHECVKDYPYYRLYLAFHSFVNGNYNLSYISAKELLSAFKDTDKNAYLCCNLLMLRCHIKVGRYDEALELIKELKPRYEDNLNDYENILPYIPLVYRELDLSLNFSEMTRYEGILEKQESKDRIWYVKVMQSIAEAYFDIGNYKKAIQITSQIKKVILYYVIPHNMIMFYYFSGEIEMASSIANSALRFALKHDITKDVSLLYTALANIDMYYGKVKEALQKYDIAVSLDKENSYTKFYNISQRCMAYARHGDLNYAKEVSHIYLKYCETYAPQYANMLLCSLAFCFYRLGNKEKAYFYATKCVTQSKSRSIFWLCGMAIATAYLLERGDLKDANSLVRNILKSSYVYGMEIMVVDNIDVFEPLLTYASKNGIETAYIDKLNTMIKKKEGMKQVSHNLKIKFFGATAVYSGNTEIQWKTRKAKELFLHYILAGKEGIDRNLIIEYLWKDYVYESAINNLKTTNNIIRKTLAQHDVDFELDYINCKYILHINNVVNDYEDFLKLLDVYKNEENIINRKNDMNELLERFKDGFAVEISNEHFNKHRASLSQEMTILLLKLVSDLIARKDYIDAKKYLIFLKQIDKSENYEKLSEEINSHLI